MTDLEQKIITLIENNNYFSKELKQKYILALFLMDADKHERYFQLIRNFSNRCNQIDKGYFILRPDEAEKIKNSFDDVKKDILKKMQAQGKKDSKPKRKWSKEEEKNEKDKPKE